MKKACLIFIILSLFLNIYLVQGQTTVEYPGDDPIFSISFPKKWKVTTEEELLHALSKDESIYVGLWALEDIEYH